MKIQRRKTTSQGRLNGHSMSRDSCVRIVFIIMFQAKKAALSSVAQQVDAKVQSFFDRLRNDAKFQVKYYSRKLIHRKGLPSG